MIDFLFFKSTFASALVHPYCDETKIVIEMAKNYREFVRVISWSACSSQKSI